MNRRNWLFCFGSIFLVFWFAGATAAWADLVLPMINFTLTPGTTGGVYYNNVITVDVTYYSIPSQQTSTASGGYTADLWATFDPSHNATITGLGFVQKVPGPGNISWTDMSFFSGLMTTSGVKTDFNTDSPPEGVTSGSFLTDGNTLILNGGILHIVGSPDTDLSVSPISIGLTGNTGTVLVSAPYLSGGAWKYDVTLLMPAGFTPGPVPGHPEATIGGSGTVRALGSFTQPIPEPGTIVMLLSMVATLAGYGWLKRRGRR